MINKAIKRFSQFSGNAVKTLTVFSMLVSNIFAPAIAIAQEADTDNSVDTALVQEDNSSTVPAEETVSEETPAEDTSEEEAVAETVMETVSEVAAEVAAEATEEADEAATTETEPVETQTESEVSTPSEKVAEEAKPEAEEKETEWKEADGAYVTESVVKTGEEYVFPTNDGVKVSFDKLPDGQELYLSIEEITLTAEEVVKVGALTDKAYDIKLLDKDGKEVDMAQYGANGSFKANVVLPGVEEENAVVKYADNVEELVAEESVDVVAEEKTDVSEDKVEVEVNHFTIFIVTDDAVSYSDPTNWTDWHDQGYFDDGVHFYELVNAGETATWNFSGVDAGVYTVYISWSTHENRAQNVHYQLNFGNGVTSMDVNQEMLADQATIGGSGEWSGWYRIGGESSVYQINTSTTSSLIMSSVDNTSDSEHVIADEVMLVPVTDDSYVASVTTAYPSPELSGKLNVNVDGTDSYNVTVEINGAPYTVTTSGGDWVLDQDTIADLPVGVYDVVVTANIGGAEPITYTAEDAVTITEVITPINLGFNIRSQSATPGERLPVDSVDLVCGSITNGDYPTYGNAMAAHNWESSEPGLRFEKYKRQWLYPGNDPLSPTAPWAPATGAVYSDPYTAFSTFGSAVGTEGQWHVRVMSWIDEDGLGDVSVGEKSSAWSAPCAITLDRTAPVLTATDIVGQEATSPAGAVVNFDDFDNLVATDVNGIASIDCDIPSGSTFALGTTTVTCTATDVAGNVSAPAVFTVEVVDRTAPTVPANLMWDAPSRTYGYDCGDTVNETVLIPDWDDSTDTVSPIDHYDYVSYWEDGSVGTTQVLSTSEFVNSWSAPDGLFGYAVRACDTAGNCSNWAVENAATPSLGTSCQITIDTEAPQITDSYISDQNYVSYNEDGDRESRISAWVVFEDERTFINGLYYEVIDSGGSIYPSGSFSDVYPDGGLECENGDLNGDFGSSTCVVTWESIDVSGLPTGTYTLRIYGVDMAGNEGGESYSIIVDNTLPSTYLGSSSDGIFDEGEYLDSFLGTTLQASDADEGDTGLYAVNFNVRLSPSPYLLTGYYAIDDLGGIDTASWTMADLFDYAEWPYYADTSVLYEGTYTIEYWAEDWVGNESEHRTVTYTVNNVAPVIDSVVVSSTPTNEQTPVSFTVEFTDPSYYDVFGPDDGDWYALVNYGDGATARVNGINELDFTVPAHSYVVSSGYGVFDVTVTVCESDTNELSENACSTPYTVKVTVNNNAPVVTVSPSEKKVTEGDSDITITASVSGGNSPYTIAWSGTDCHTTSDPYKVQVDTDKTGRFYCTATVTDSDGDKASAVAYVKVRAEEDEGDDNEGGNESGPSVQGVSDTTTEEAVGTIAPETVEETTVETPAEESVLGEKTCDSTRKLTGYVYYDLNSNAKRDSGETGQGGVTVTVYYIDDNGKEVVVEDVDTDSNGYWETQVCPGDYKVRIDKTDLPNGVVVDGEAVKGVTVNAEDNEVEVGYQVKDTRGFFAKYWWLVLLALVVVGGMILAFVGKKKESENV